MFGKQQQTISRPIYNQSKEEDLQKLQWDEEDRQAKTQESLLKRTKSFEDAMQKPVSSHVEKLDVAYFS